jgi:pyruvate,water dikinase
MHLFLVGRGLLLQLGERLAAARVLESGDDLFYLTVSEISGLVGRDSDTMHAAAIAARRRLQVARAAVRAAPELIGPEGEVLEDRLPDHGSRRDGQVSLTGRGAAPGVAEGPVRVIRSPSDSGSIRLGDVLVLPAGDLGSTLYFPLAAAMVVERGSLLSHAVVLAREYGLPTVVGVLSANALADGLWVRVDGSRGTVSVVSPHERWASRATSEGPA